MINVFDLIDKNNDEIIENILREDVSILGIPNQDGITPLLYALYTGKKKLAEKMYSKNFNFSIFEYIGMQDIERVKDCINKEPTVVNGYSLDGWTALHLASFWGNKKIVLLLIEHGAIQDIPSKSKASSGNSALQAAIAMQQFEIVELLLSKGANPNFLQKPSNFTPLHIAASRDNEKIISLLLEKGADKTQKSTDGKLPIDIAREHKKEKNQVLLTV